MSDIYTLDNFTFISDLPDESLAELSDGLEAGENAEELRVVEERGASSSSGSASISNLVCYTAISPNKSYRTAKIEGITIHHMAGNFTIERCGEIFSPTSRKASSNYGIGTDGRIACYVPENFRSWCSSNSANDNRCVTIEVADSVAAEPWPISDAAYESLIQLCADICLRNGIKALIYTGTTAGNLTRHNMFAATLCPGPYLEERFPAIAKEVTKRVQAGTIYAVPEKQEEKTEMTYETWCKYMERYMAEAVKSDPSPWAKAACEKAIQKGIMKGDGSGAYNFQRPLTREAYLVMQDREGLL